MHITYSLLFIFEMRVSRIRQINGIKPSDIEVKADIDPMRMKQLDRQRQLNKARLDLLNASRSFFNSPRHRNGYNAAAARIIMLLICIATVVCIGCALKSKCADKPHHQQLVPEAEIPLQQIQNTMKPRAPCPLGAEAKKNILKSKIIETTLTRRI